MNEHLGLGDVFAVVRVIFPLVAVVVAAPSVSIVFRQVRCHVPERRLIVVEVVVKVEHAGVNGAVGLDDGHVGQLDVSGHVVLPHRFDHPVLHQKMPLVHDVGFSGHGHDASLQHVSTGMHVVVESVTTDHVLGGGVVFTFAPSGRGRLDFRNRSVGGLHVGEVPPGVLGRVGEGIHEVSCGVRNGGRIAVPIIEFNSGTRSENHDVVVGLDGGVPSQAARCRTAVGHVVQKPIGDVHRLRPSVPQFNELVGRRTDVAVVVPIGAVVAFRGRRHENFTDFHVDVSAVGCVDGAMVVRQDRTGALPEEHRDEEGGNKEAR